MMTRGINYVPQPTGIDRNWQTPMEVYLYLLYTPHERSRIQNEINAHWSYGTTSVRVIHRCTAEIRLPPHMGDQSFIAQLYYLLKDEGITFEDSTVMI